MEFHETLGDLAQSGVSFVVIGGMLRPLYAPANPRPTFDIDVVIEPAGTERLVRHLYQCGYRLLTRFEAKPWTEPVVDTVQNEDEAVGMAIARPAVSFFRDHPYALVDAWRDVGIPFAELELRSRRMALTGVEVAIVDADDWRRLKELANREKDRADLEAFQKPLELTNRREPPGSGGKR